MKSFKQHINEAKYKPGEVQSKDWTRMMDLVLSGKENSKVANSIKDKDKAIARFVAGNKLAYGDVEFKSIRWPDFEEFKDKAIELGATEDEILQAFNKTKIPTKVFDKYKSLKDKKLDNRFVGVISKAVIKMGYDIKFLPHNGNAITRDGQEAMQRNGRKWTIGYKTELTKDGETISLVFDAITDESVDTKPTYYVIDTFKNLTTGESLTDGWNGVMGQREFLALLKESLI